MSCVINHHGWQTSGVVCFCAPFIVFAVGLYGWLVMFIHFSRCIMGHMHCPNRAHGQRRVTASAAWGGCPREEVLACSLYRCLFVFYHYITFILIAFFHSLVFCCVLWHSALFPCLLTELVIFYRSFCHSLISVACSLDRARSPAHWLSLMLSHLLSGCLKCSYSIACSLWCCIMLFHSHVLLLTHLCSVTCFLYYWLTHECSCCSLGVLLSFCAFTALSLHVSFSSCNAV